MPIAMQTMNEALRNLVLAFEKALAPPPRMEIVTWIEANIVLPKESAAIPGRFRLWSYQIEIARAMADPRIPRVSVMKATRIGYTKMLVAVMAAQAANASASSIVLLPTDDDVARFARDDFEPVFSSSPNLKSILLPMKRNGRNTRSHRSTQGGGSFKLISARAPRKLRAHSAKNLYCDEVDAMEITAEGNPLLLAEKRTLDHSDRKIIIGSTPTVEGMSNIEARYNESDMRILEVPCKHCGDFSEILWQDIRWPEGEPEKAEWACRACGGLHADSDKRSFIKRARFRALRPDVRGHAGFQVSSLVSEFENASWGNLALEYVKAKQAGPADLQVFVNTVEGRVWKQTLDAVEPDSLLERVEAFGLDAIPADVLALVAGCDVQQDRIEVSFIGLTTADPCVLAHFVVEGDTKEDRVWRSLDELLSRRWKHPNGWDMELDAAAIDAGDGNRADNVYSFTADKYSRGIFAVRGATGVHRVAMAPAKRNKRGERLAIIGVDPLKTEIMERLAATVKSEGLMTGKLRFSNSLPADYFDQVTGERRFIRYVKNRAMISWRPKRASQRVEALDCLVYGLALRLSLPIKRIDWEARARRTGDLFSKSSGSGGFSRHAADLNG